MKILTRKPDVHSLDFEIEEWYKELIPIRIKSGDIDTKPPISNKMTYDVSKLDYRFEKLREIKMLKRNLKYINVEDKIYGELFNQNFLEHYELDSVDDLLYLEGFDIEFFIEFNNYIEKRVSWMINEIRRQISVLFQLEKKKPNIMLKNKLPDMSKEQEDFVSRDYTYILTQNVIEYNPTVIFPENIGRAVSDWSLREIEYHLGYITSKTRKEEVENKFMSKCMENRDKKNGR